MGETAGIKNTALGLRNFAVYMDGEELPNVSKADLPGPLMRIESGQDTPNLLLLRLHFLSVTDAIKAIRKLGMRHIEVRVAELRWNYIEAKEWLQTQKHVLDAKPLSIHPGSAASAFNEESGLINNPKAKSDLSDFYNMDAVCDFEVSHYEVYGDKGRRLLLYNPNCKLCIFE